MTSTPRYGITHPGHPDDLKRMPMIGLRRWRFVDDDGTSRCYELERQTWVPRKVDQAGNWIPIEGALSSPVELAEAQGYVGERVAAPRIPNPPAAGATPATRAKRKRVK